MTVQRPAKSSRKPDTTSRGRARLTPRSAPARKSKRAEEADAIVLIDEMLRSFDPVVEICTLDTGVVIGGVEILGSAAIEELAPVRLAGWWPGQTHRPSLVYTATMDDHRIAESHLEAMWIRAADLDPEVVAIATQPLRLWTLVEDTPRPHSPDLLLGMSSGINRLVNIKPESMRTEAFERQETLCRSVCDQLGWDYQTLGSMNPVLEVNLMVLGACAAPCWGTDDLADAIVAAAAEPITIDSLCTLISDPRTKPTIFHLVWTHRLTIKSLDHNPISGKCLVAANTVIDHV